MLSWFEWQVFQIRWTHKSKGVRSNVSAKIFTNVIKFTAFLDQIYSLFCQVAKCTPLYFQVAKHRVSPTYLLNLNKHLTNVLLNPSLTSSGSILESLSTRWVFLEMLKGWPENPIMWILQIANWMDSFYSFHSSIGLLNTCWQWNASLLPSWNLSYQSKTLIGLTSILCASIHSLRTGKAAYYFLSLKIIHAPQDFKEHFIYMPYWEDFIFLIEYTSSPALTLLWLSTAI